MDEATGSLDYETDTKIQETVSQMSSTIITIASITPLYSSSVSTSTNSLPYAFFAISTNVSNSPELSHIA